MRVAVLAKQVPGPSELILMGGRLVRDGVHLETNAYCRRANARAVEIAGKDGEVVVFSMGPPTAEQTLREMIACGASQGVLITDRLLAGSDTLITARVLARALELEAPFDLVLGGAFSLDSETGHIPIQVAELLGLPFIGPCRTLAVVNGVAVATIEHEGGFADVEVLLPAVASAAERLCAPSKASPEQCAAVAAERIVCLRAADLGLREDDVGLAGSPTQVGHPLPAQEVGRACVKTTSVGEAISALEDRAWLVEAAVPRQREPLGEPGRSLRGEVAAVWCVLDPSSDSADEGLMAAVAELAHGAGRRVVAVTGHTLAKGVAGPADHLLRFDGPDAAQDWEEPLCGRLASAPPHCVIIQASNWGRELAARTAARLGWGLVGDAVKFTVEDSRITAWKSAFSGQAMVPITSTSPTLLATVRPEMLDGSAVYEVRATSIETVATAPVCRVIYDPPRDVDADGRELGRARCVVIVGSGVAPEEYAALDELRNLLGAGPLAATRKVTDRGWLPRTRQIGITGRSVAPEVVVSIAASGKFNHVAGFARAGHVLAINSDPDAQIFEHADIGIVGDWHQIVIDLCDALRHPTART